MKVPAILLACLFYYNLLLACTSAESAIQPNVVLILADDLAIGDLGGGGHGRCRTPNLDKLSSQSVRFSQAYSASCVCAPARAALLTGRYPHRTGVVTLNMNEFPELTRLRKDETTIADLMSKAGYATGLVGKWHVGRGKGYDPLARGFDEFEGFDGSQVLSYFDYALEVQGKAHPVKNKYLTDDLTERAIDFVRRHRSHPFFLHLAHYAPHRPLEAPQELIEDYRQKGFSDATATIYAMIEVMDRGIGKLLSEIDSLGLAEKTIVIFASDNGPDPLTGERFNRELRGTKYQVYEGGIRVPLFVRWTGTLNPGPRNQTVHFVDFLPTVLELCNIEQRPSQAIDGVSFKGVLRDSTLDFAPVRFWQWNRGSPNYTHNAAVRDGDYKLVRPFVTRGLQVQDSAEPPALFNLLDDPSESHNIAEQNPVVVSRMNASLELWANSIETDRIRPITTEIERADTTFEATDGQGLTDWQEKAVAYARIMSQVKWTPVADGMPMRGGHFTAGTEYTGVPYSSVKSVGRYIGFDIFLKTFLAAVENPHSVLYTENLEGDVSNAECYYGKVCSSYTSYALQCGIWYISRVHIPPYRDGVILVEPQSAQSARVGDIIFTPPRPGSHIEIVTDVKKDRAGKVTHVRVEESRPKTTKSTNRNAADFDSHLGAADRKMYRITDLDAWREGNRAEEFLFPNYAEDSVTPVVNRVLLLDRGDWVPYFKRQSVKFNVMDRDARGVRKLVIKRGDAVVEEIDRPGKGVVERTFATCGDYTAHCVMSDGSSSPACEFSVCDLDFKLPDDEIARGEPWELEFSSDNMKIIIVYFRSHTNGSAQHMLYPSDDDRGNGTITIPAGMLTDKGKAEVWLIGENKYGRLKVRKELSIK